MTGSEKCTRAPPWAFAAANSPPWQLRIGLRDRRAVALERVLVDDPQHTGDDVVEVYGTADFLAFAYPLSGSVNTVASVRGFLLPAPADRCPS